VKTAVSTFVIACFGLHAVSGVGARTSQSPAASGASAGRSVWDGVFTQPQAERGRGFFLEHCAGCHGADLRGGEAKALVGTQFWANWQETDVDYLLGQIRKNMPFSEDGSLAGTLGESTYVDIVAHILTSNGFPAGPRELTSAASVGVRIVPKEGPGELPADAFAHVVGCLARGGGGEWQLVRATRPARATASSVPQTDSPLGDRVVVLKFVITPLQKYEGFRMSATGRLIGEGGSGGLNVSRIAPVSQTCS
jgi:quinoprotein glucose dehydrogenase